MIVFRGLNDPHLKSRPRSIAIGIFDGVHRGHQSILKSMQSFAKRFKASSMVVTFDPHPSKVLFPGKNPPPILMSLDHRLRLLERMGIRESLIIPFNRKFSKLSREAFLNKILLKKLGMKSLSVGHDFRFGYKALGDSAYLEQSAAKKIFYFSQVAALKMGTDVISSTRIRSLIEKGELVKASKMLGRPVSVYGTVIRGRGRGRSLGFPTANLNPHHEALPPPGVYAAYGYLGATKLKAVIHIGERPTFKDREKSLEAHFLHFHKNIYGRDVELIFVKRLRSITPFKNPAALIEAIHKDIRQAREIL